VNLIEKKGDHFVFHVDKREKRLLFETLQLYPLIPSAHHRLTRSGESDALKENQKLLEESLNERRQQNRKQLMAMLNEEHRFVETEGGGFHLALTAPQVDWLLQLLNDIRVGSWILLGEPDEKHGRLPQVTDQNVLHLVAMEFCGYFQMVLLDAFERRS
jgi:hypothetical protein